MKKSSDVETYSAIDITKFIFSVCIVILHTNVHGYLSVNEAYYFEKCVLRLAVPYFFCVSGFFLGRKLYDSNVSNYKLIIKNYILRLLKPLVFFESINIILESIKMYMQGVSTLLILKDNLRYLFFYPYGALWYIQASIIAAMLIYPFILKNKINKAILLGILFYLFALLANNYYFVADTICPFLKKYVDVYLSIFVSARNGLFVGFLFISIGIKMYDIHRGGVNYSASTVLLLLSGILYFCEIMNLKGRVYADDGALFFTHIIVIPCLVLNLAKCKVCVSGSVLLRNLSTGIYLVHRIILSILFILNQLFGFPYVWATNFIIVMVCSCVLCFMAYKTDCRPFCSLLK